MGAVRRSTWVRAAGLAISVACVGGCGSSDGQASAAGKGGGAQAVPVAVGTVTKKDVPLDLHAIGTVEASSTVNLRSQVSGQVAEVRFTEGQEVRRGQVLFTIDPRPFRAALDEVRANRARDEATARNAASELERRERLFREGILSKDEHDEARTRSDAARAVVRADAAAVDAAKLELEHATIASPVDGRVGRVLVHAGNVIKAEETDLAVVHQTRPIFVRFTVPERELPRIRRRLREGPLEVAATPTGDARAVGGRLTFIDNAVDPATGTVLLKAEFENADEALWPGQFASVALTIETVRAAVVAPSPALLTGQSGDYAFVVRPDRTVESRPVTVGATVAGETIVEKGLRPGEQVVTDGQLRLAPGISVEIKNPAAS